MAARDIRNHRARAEAAHAAASHQIERLDQVGRALAELTELATTLAGHLADLRRVAWDLSPPRGGHRY